ncbi:AAA family ATPase [Bradyrhizobium sp. LTSP885]|uniref:AAA family ATPase n=1 Tax=Bradyrhizobium sp. LTSP885 TaxID=1619232 RepID=UPI0006993F24|nr:AAA family ATPase [Bradyrhizobium sp. LTSP885]
MSDFVDTFEETARLDLPYAAEQALASFERTLDAAPRNNVPLIFTRACTEVMRLAKPDVNPEDWQSLVDHLYGLGRRYELADDVVQNLMEAGALAPPDRQPGHRAAPPSSPLGPIGKPAPDREPEPTTLITPAHWPAEAPPPVNWLVDHRIPRGDVTTLHGDGGAGKTDIAMQLAEGCARGAGYWMGHELAAGPVVILSAEEPERELRRRIWLHSCRDGFNPADLVGLHLWFPDDVAGAVFATPARSGLMVPSPLFRSIEAAIVEIAPVLVIVDNVAATYTGNQNDRVMVRSYVNLWRSIARLPSLPAVLLLDHPSLSGLTNGNGRGGNMDWRNAVRSALYLRVPEDKVEAERGVRILETQKSNYGPTGQPVRLQWGDGGLALEKGPSSLVRLAEDAKIDELFLQLLDKRLAQGRPVRPSTGRGSAPAELAGDPDAIGVTAEAFRRAMERLFTAGKIKNVETGPASKRRKHIERA